MMMQRALFCARHLAAGVIFGTFMDDSLASFVITRGSSMEPTLSGSELVLLDRFHAANFKYERGDVVVLSAPFNPKMFLVKRVIGLQGDVIRFGTTTQEVPKGHCWVEGDNPKISFDSRNMGPVPMGLLRGKVVRVLWPPPRFGPIRPGETRAVGG